MDTEASQEHNSKTALTILLAYKTLIFLTIYLSQILVPLVFNTKTMRSNFNWGQSFPVNLESYFRTWDATLYLFLSEFGYQKAHVANAMYPLWPYVIRAGTFIIGDSLWSALLLSNILSLAALYLFHRLVFDQYGNNIANRSLLLILAFPGALFFNLAYSESLFLFLCVLCFSFISRKQLQAAAIIGFFIPLVKAIGIFIIIPLSLTFYAAYKDKRIPLRSLTLITLPLLGYASYFLIMQIATGDALAGFKSQIFFMAKSSIWKLFDIVHFIKTLFSFEVDHTPFTSIFDRIWFLFVAVALFFLYRINRFYFFFALPLTLVPAIGTSLMSYTRYAAVVFPLFFAYSYALQEKKWQPIYWLTLSSFCIIQIIFLLRHINYYWVA